MQLPYNPALAVLSIYPREIKTYVPHGNLYLNVYSSLTHNCQKLETIQMSLKRWMVKKYMVYSHHGILLGNKKEGPTYCYVQWPRWISRWLCWMQKPTPKGYILYDSIYVTESQACVPDPQTLPRSSLREPGTQANWPSTRGAPGCHC